MTEGKVANVPN